MLEEDRNQENIRKGLSSKCLGSGGDFSDDLCPLHVFLRTGPAVTAPLSGAAKEDPACSSAPQEGWFLANAIVFIENIHEDF